MSTSAPSLLKGKAAEEHLPIGGAEADDDPVGSAHIDLPGGGDGDPFAGESESKASRAIPAQSVSRAEIEAWLDQAMIEEVQLCEQHVTKLREKERRQEEVQRKNMRIRELPSFTDPHDLYQTGWGVIFPESPRPGVSTALGPLLDRRQRMAGYRYKSLFQQRGESARQFLEQRHRSPPGVIEPDRMPYFLLIVGGPDEIPFDFQYQLSIHHAVGRIHFDNVRDYRQYAQSVVAAETTGTSLPARLSMFSVEHAGDPATAALARHLVGPLARDLGQGLDEWQIETWGRERAYKRDLAQLLGGAATPGVLLAACHGLSVPYGSEHQRRQQGALICQDSSTIDEVSLDHCFTASDLPSGARLQGLITLLLACHGAGTPVADSYPDKGWQPGKPVRRKPVAPEPFLACLPQALLSHGALAVLGHIDRGWTTSFSWLLEGQLNEAAANFEDILRRLLRGHRLGHALRPLYRRYAALAAHLAPVVEKFIRGEEVDLSELRLLRTAVNDARNFVVLGDPAIYARGSRKSA